MKMDHKLFTGKEYFVVYTEEVVDDEGTVIGYHYHIETYNKERDARDDYMYLNDYKPRMFKYTREERPNNYHHDMKLYARMYGQKGVVDV
jgi:predicted TIM-barrel fold metal-dependent hydrolase